MSPVTTLNLEIPDDILASLGLDAHRAQAELKKDLAVAPYARRVSFSLRRLGG